MDAISADLTTDGEFQIKGYVVRPFLDKREVSALTQLHDTLPPDLPCDFYSTVFSRNTDYRRRVSDGIGSLIRPRLAALFPNHELCFAVFVTKGRNSTKGALPLHRDYSFVDVKLHTAVHLWFPLIDVDATNGCLQIVGGSHKLFERPYAINEYPRLSSGALELLYRAFATAVPMAAGSVLAYESRLLHGSGENRSNSLRPACVAILLPKGVCPRVYVWNGVRPMTFDVLEVTTEFLLHMERGSPITKPYPEGVTYLESLDYSTEPQGIQDLVSLRS